MVGVLAVHPMLPRCAAHCTLHTARQLQCTAPLGVAVSTPNLPIRWVPRVNLHAPIHDGIAYRTALVGRVMTGSWRGQTAS